MNNKGADQSARMRRLVCTFVVCKPQRQGFSRDQYNPEFVYLFWGLTSLSRIVQSYHIKNYSYHTVPGQASPYKCFNPLTPWKFFPLFCRLLIFSKSTFSKNYFRSTIRVSNSLDPDQTNILSGLIWVQTVCKSYHQTTLGE